jgi:hypothetical protein
MVCVCFFVEYTRMLVIILTTRRQTGVARLLCGLLVHILKTGVERFLCGLLQHILKHIFVKLIFKTFTLENSKKKGPNIYDTLRYHSLYYRPPLPVLDPICPAFPYTTSLHYLV